MNFYNEIMITLLLLKNVLCANFDLNSLTPEAFINLQLLNHRFM